MATRKGRSRGAEAASEQCSSRHGAVSVWLRDDFTKPHPSEVRAVCLRSERAGISSPTLQGMQTGSTLGLPTPAGTRDRWPRVASLELAFRGLLWLKPETAQLL